MADEYQFRKEIDELRTKILDLENSPNSSYELEVVQSEIQNLQSNIDNIDISGLDIDLDMELRDDGGLLIIHTDLYVDYEVSLNAVLDDTEGLLTICVDIT